MTHPTFVSIAFLMSIRVLTTAEDLGTLDVQTQSLPQVDDGTELILLEKDLEMENSYRLEDFFWTGSIDGDDDFQTEYSTMYKTTTVLSTIYIQATSTGQNRTTEKPRECINDCNSIEISPTPTYNSNEEYEDDEDADRNFWLVTILKTDGKDPDLLDLKRNLAKLYKTAFQRQQENHLGIHRNRSRRDVKAGKPVKIYIHKIERTRNGDERINLLYHVSLAGQPVDAPTAAADMNLISDEEVTHELGYPFIIKAEPYIKVRPPEHLASTKDTWLLVGISLAVLFVLLLGVALFLFALTKRKKSGGVAALNKRQVFQRTAKTMTSMENETRERKPSPSYINFRGQPSNETLNSGEARTRAKSSSSSSMSSGSVDVSPLLVLNKRQGTSTKTRAKSTNKTAPIFQTSRTALITTDTDSSSEKSRKFTPETIIVDNQDPGVVSPKSYLSMPSVKSFPRVNVPEPLSKVLEPVSIYHLDDDDSEEERRLRCRSPLARHGSLSAVEDPGIIGPIVWTSHCKRLQHGISVDRGIDDAKMPANSSRMRRRFNELLDETFSLFGSRRSSPVPDKRMMPVEVKSRSAITSRGMEEIQVVMPVRPKTAVSRRVEKSPGSRTPKGAWTSMSGSPRGRPLSAGPVPVPKVDVVRVLAEGKFVPHDPAIPLIEAIKTELGKCSIPGSTSNVNE